jgi:hypothetical protein
VLCLYTGVISLNQEEKSRSKDHYALSSLDSSQWFISAQSQGGVGRFIQHAPFDPKAHTQDNKKRLMQEFKKQIQEEFYQESRITFEKFYLKGLNETSKQKSRKNFEQQLPQQFEIKYPAEKLAAMLEERFAKEKTSLSKFTEGVASLAAGDTPELQQLILNNTEKEPLCHANVAVLSLQYKGALIFVLTALYDIPENSMLGFDYGLAYFKSREIKPLYFTQQGKILTQPQLQYILTEEEKNELERVKSTVYGLGVKEFRDKNYQSAQNHVEHAQAIFIKICSYYSPENALACSTLASIYRDSNRIDLAIDMAIQAVLITETIKGERLNAEYEKLINCLSRMEEIKPALQIKARTLNQQGHTQLALTLQKEMLNKHTQLSQRPSLKS